MTKRYPMASKVIISQPYRASYDTDIRATIKAERKRLAAAAVVVHMPALVVDTVGAVDNRTAHLGKMIRPDFWDKAPEPVPVYSFNCLGKVRKS